MAVKRSAWIEGEDPIGDLEPLTVALAQHLRERENWSLAMDMSKVMASRYLAALAVDFVRLRKEEL